MLPQLYSYIPLNVVCVFVSNRKLHEIAAYLNLVTPPSDDDALSDVYSSEFLLELLVRVLLPQLYYLTSSLNFFDIRCVCCILFGFVDIQCFLFYVQCVLCHFLFGYRKGIWSVKCVRAIVVFFSDKPGFIWIKTVCQLN